MGHLIRSSLVASSLVLAVLAGCTEDPTGIACEGINFSTDARHCGRCNHACNAGETCLLGECLAPDPCAGKDLTSDPQNCGTCGQACDTGETCVDRTCVPPDPCAGKDLTSDEANCGTCGHVCDLGDTCVDRKCVTPDPCEGMDLTSDPQNCGTCGLACPDGDSCVARECLAPPPLEVGFIEPDTDATVWPVFTVTLDFVATGTVDSLEVTSEDLPTLKLDPAHPTGQFVAPDGPLVLTAKIAQGSRTATATRHVVVDSSSLMLGLSGEGFYLGTETVTLSATPPTGLVPAKVDVRVQGSDTALATLTAPGADGRWTASIPAADLGRGDVALDLVATTATGLTVSAEAQVTVALLHDTANPDSPGLVQALTTPRGEGALHVASIVPGAEDGSTPAIGELRFTRFGGGATALLARRVCASGGSEIVASANGAFVLARAEPEPLLNGAVLAGVEPCRTLLLADLTSPSTSAQTLTLDYDGRSFLALDGGVVLWAERPAAGGDRTWWAAAPGEEPFGVDLTEEPSLFVLGKSAIVAFDAFEPYDRAVLITPSGALTLTRNNGGNPAVRNVRLEAQDSLLVTSSSGRWLAAYDRVNSDLTEPVLIDLSTGDVSSLCALDGDCVPAGNYPDFLTLPGDRFVVASHDWSDSEDHVRWVDAATGTKKELGAARLETNGVRPRDGSAVFMKDQFLAVHRIDAEGRTLRLLGNSEYEGTASTLGSLGVTHSGWGLVTEQSGLLYTPWERPTAHVAARDGALVLSVDGADPVRLDSSASPWQGGPFVITADRTRVVYATATNNVGTPGALWMVPLNASALPVRLAPPGSSNALGQLPQPVLGKGPGESFLGARVPFVVPIGDGITRLYVANADGSAVTAPYTGTDVDEYRPFGLTPDDAYVWWFSRTDEALHAVAIGGGTPITLGQVDSEEVAVLPGPIAIGRQDTETSSRWIVLDGGESPRVLGPANSGYNDLDVSDDGRTAFVQTESSEGALWVVDGNGVRVVHEGGQSNRTRTSGLRASLSFDGTLRLQGMRLADLAPRVVEDLDVLQYEERESLPVPGPAGFTMPESYGTHERFTAGARRRMQSQYVLGGETRPGVYLWTVRDRATEQAVPE